MESLAEGGRRWIEVCSIAFYTITYVAHPVIKTRTSTRKSHPRIPPMAPTLPTSIITIIIITTHHPPPPHPSHLSPPPAPSAIHSPSPTPAPAAPAPAPAPSAPRPSSPALAPAASSSLGNVRSRLCYAGVCLLRRRGGRARGLCC